MIFQKMLKTSTTENFINGGILIENMALAGRDKKNTLYLLCVPLHRINKG
jgi:hypothetical protein